MTISPTPGSYEDDVERALAIAENFKSRCHSRTAAKERICKLGLADSTAGAEELIREGELSKGRNTK